MMEMCGSISVPQTALAYTGIIAYERDLTFPCISFSPNTAIKFDLLNRNYVEMHNFLTRRNNSLGRKREKGLNFSLLCTKLHLDFSQLLTQSSVLCLI